MKYLRDIWSGLKREAGHDYVVYAVNDHTMSGFKLTEECSDAKIHRSLAHRENNHPKRQSAGVIQPGSFNFLRVRAVTFEDAVVKAKENGLVHEPIKTVLARHLARNIPDEDIKKTGNDNVWEDLLEKMKAGTGPQPPRR